MHIHQTLLPVAAAAVNGWPHNVPSSLSTKPTDWLGRTSPI